jgi:curved DNA-binding protein CbpA
MASDTDFVALYQALELDSGCTLDELRQAYRKRVGILHPDRRDANLHATVELQRLNALYAAAMEFQRRHGRLPGALQSSTTASGSEPGISTAMSQASAEASRTPRKVRANMGLLLAILALLLISLWIAATPGSGENAAVPVMQPATEPVLASAQDRHPAARSIELGASAQQVREIHGEPISGWEQRWEYGPSWIAFHCGVVVDWYSSPLRPLKVASERPAATTAWSPPRNCKD